MKQLKKIILTFAIVMTCLLTCIKGVNAKTINVHNLLKKGDYNNEVKILQTELNKVMNCNLTVDGDFGTKTKTCVQNFQKKYDLDADGIVGASTSGKLNTLYLANNNYVVINVDSNVNGGKLNVRTDASTSAEKIGTTKYGTIFRVHGSKKDSAGYTWYKIYFNNKYAYIRSDYTTKDAIVVDISSQTLKLYKNGKLTMDTIVITGTKGKYDTRTGKFTLNTTKKRLAKMLRDTTFVDYWMPFDKGNGFHDANYHYSNKKKETVGWRSEAQFYEADRYTWDGSHGCVNMLFEDAKTLYEITTKNILVFVRT